MDEYKQIDIWDYLSENAPKQEVEVEGAYSLKQMPIQQYKVLLTYGDLVLIVAMIEDYVRGLDVIKAGDIQWSAYYHSKFHAISERIQKQIDYDYEKKRKECLKKSEKESNSDIGEEAIALTIKRAMAAKEKEQREADQNESQMD